MRLKFLSILLVQFVVATSSACADNLESAKDANSGTTIDQKSAEKTETDSSQFSVSKAAVDGILSTVTAPTTVQLDQIETDAFSHSYSSDTTEQRICRLEQFVYGKQFSGDLSKRLKKVQKALAPKEIEKATDVAPPPPEPIKTHVGLIDVMNRGIDNYNGHKYTKAEDDFEECCAMAPGMSRCFSYLAITKMQLNLRQAAIDAFRISLCSIHLEHTADMQNHASLLSLGTKR